MNVPRGGKFAILGDVTIVFCLNMIADLSNSPYDAIVIGAGLGVLLAAKRLTAAGLRVVVLEKGRGVGGRMATRRMDESVFDHGAQFYNARDAAFMALVEQWQKGGIVSRWSTGFALSTGGFKDDGIQRFRGVSGMRELPSMWRKALKWELPAILYSNF